MARSCSMRRSSRRHAVRWRFGWPSGPTEQMQHIAFVEGVVRDGRRGGNHHALEAHASGLLSFRWVAIQMALAGVFAALARAPRLGRPRPDPASGADRPAAHAEALGALLARGRATTESHELLERYRHWRWPHGFHQSARSKSRASPGTTEQKVKAAVVAPPSRAGESGISPPPTAASGSARSKSPGLKARVPS